MLRFALILLLTASIPATAWATIAEAATSKDEGVERGMPSSVMAGDFLRAARPDVSPLSRLVLSQSVEFLAQPGMPESNITAAQWQPIRDGALREGADDPMVQAVFLLRNLSEMNAAGARNHAVDVLMHRVGQNGQFGMILLSIPEVIGDAQTERDLLHQAARATGFASPYTATQHALAEDLADFRWTHATDATLPVMSDEVQSATVASTLAAVGAILQIGPVARLCRAATGAMRDDCQALGQNLFKHSETAIDTMLALRLIELTAPSDQVREQVVNERRQFAWQSEQLQSLWADGKRDSPSIRQHLERQRRLTEMAAMRETLVALNLPLQPPAGWRSSGEKFEEQERKNEKGTPPKS